MAYLITYIPKRPSEINEELISSVKKYKNWAILNYTNFIVNDDTTSPSDIRTDVGMKMVDGDKLLVSELTGNAAWRNLNEDVSKWLKKNL